MMTTELGPTLCGRLWRASKTLRESSWQLDKLKIRKEEILEQIDNQKSYATNRSKQALPPLLQQVRDSAESIEKLMIERNYELEQVHTRLRGHKNSQAVFKKIRRRRPGVEKEIQRYNSLVDALPIGPELKPDKLDYELLQREMRDEVDVSSFLHHFFKLENLGIAASDVPCWVNNSDMRKSIQLHLQVQALREEIGILHAEVLRVVKWSMENLKALIAYANSQHRCAILLVEKIWSGIKVAHGLSSNIDSMYNADFSMEDVKRLKPDLEDVVQRAYSCLFQEQTESDDAEILPEDGGEDIGGNETDIVDEEDEDYISNDAIFELAMLFANDSHEAN
ncbi:hypothetical protein LIPSTDRAFT_31172 [Lipomyces starkeyi NRRL Y-11557]|uniref:Uncharacterized protein n=2 Tax=Lipomyces starkeyi NRRL Y-11557 TaxID=675824 RepID=A0A1E3PTF8_LIPST|nr:hypothetical protein LIPSTDRAFT_31172 [Lipomyces starkeyi NRRL Y-11557]